MPRVAVAAAWLCQLEPEHRLGVTLVPPGAGLAAFCRDPLLLCLCGFLLFPFFCRECYQSPWPELSTCVLLQIQSSLNTAGGLEFLKWEHCPEKGRNGAC